MVIITPPNPKYTKKFWENIMNAPSYPLNKLEKLWIILIIVCAIFIIVGMPLCVMGIDPSGIMFGSGIIGGFLINVIMFIVLGVKINKKKK